MLCQRYNIRRVRLDDPDLDLIPKWSDALTEDEVYSKMERFRNSDRYYAYYVEPCPVGNIKIKVMRILFLEHCFQMKEEK